MSLPGTTNGAVPASSSSAKRPRSNSPRRSNPGSPRQSPRGAAAHARPQKHQKLQRRDCPYLSTINRNVLDFDFERVCSVTLSDQNVYCCLCCGKFFQGRGRGTQAYLHSLQDQHFVYMNLADTNVYCLPEDYEVIDASLADIKYNLKPEFSHEQVQQIASGQLAQVHAKSLDGTDFIPGCVGLNNIGKNSDYMNVILQLFTSIVPIRNFLLEYNAPDRNTKQFDPVLASLSSMAKKIYNVKNFKGIVSPHEFFQAVGRASGKRFYGTQQDPVALFSWLVSWLKKKMKKATPSLDLLKIFEGEVSVKNSETDMTGWTETFHPCVIFQLDLPDAPLFRVASDFIPQVALFTLLDKYNGESVHESITKSGESREVRKFNIRRLPPYVVFQIKRFQNNNFFVEKNPFIVNFPLMDLDLAPYLQPGAEAANPETKFNLVANVVHSGKAKGGEYKIQIQNRQSQQWFEIQDLRVTDILAQDVALAETYMLVYERTDVQADGSFRNTTDVEIQEVAGGADEEEPIDLAALGIQIA